MPVPDKLARGLAAHTPRSRRGQSLVEFALLLPLLLILLLGIADFGRVFADGITTEAAARNAAEAGAQEYLQLCAKTSDVDPLCDNGLSGPDYAAIHDLALDVACRESDRLTNVASSSGSCTNPTIAVCIHDNVTGDAGTCGIEGSAAGVPSACTSLNNADGDGDGQPDHPWSPVRNGPANGRPFVEVRICYRYAPLIALTQDWFGSVWLQRENSFAVTNY